MVFVLSHCRGHCKPTPKMKRLSHVFSLKMPLKEKKKCYCFSCALVLSVILGGRELDYVNLYFALFFL